MRIWSKVLIPVLPTKQLKSMRYELGDMIKQHPNIKHPLVKFSNNYDVMFLYLYFMEVCKEMDNRNINMNRSYNDSISNLVCSKTRSGENYQFNEDNRDYLNICYWNLYEKYLRKIITYEEWKKIEDSLIPLVDFEPPVIDSKLIIDMMKNGNKDLII